MRDLEKSHLIENGEVPQRAFLVGVQTAETTAEKANELLDELGELVDTLGLVLAGRLVVKLREPNARFYIGEGKAREVKDLAERLNADVIVFDDYLTPSQQRNWEGLGHCAVIDRQEVILDIFARHARSNEATLQVALAQANYSLPRLRRKWTHLNRQRGMAGGMGLRGEGEQQIEVDSRIIRARIAKLKTQLEEVQRHRQVQRSQRQRKPVPVAAIVGYTNAGKSSLLNGLTQAGVLAENKLFATLDPTIRRLKLPGGQPLLLADTVGFIRKLPHLLVEAFKSTLEETAMADYLVEVLDGSAPSLAEHHRTTLEVLEEIGVKNKPMICVINKVDLLEDPLQRRRLQLEYPEACFISAKTGEGLDQLTQEMERLCGALMTECTLLIPHSRYDALARVREACHILSEEYEADGIRVHCRVPAAAMDRFQTWMCPES